FKWDPDNHLRIYSDAEDPDDDGEFSLFWNNLTGIENYSIYTHDNYITKINASVSYLGNTTELSYSFMGLDNGIYYYKIVGKRQDENVSSNCIKVQIFKAPPEEFTLFSDAEDPDLDGTFNLQWNASFGADNYSVYHYEKYITTINESIDEIAKHITDLTFSLFLLDVGSHFFKIVAYNEYGNISSNCLRINVQIPKISFEDWYRTWGLIGDSDFALDIAIDSMNDIYTTGFISGDMGPSNLTLNKFNSTGNLYWNINWGGDMDDRGDGIFIDSFNNIYIAGSTQSYSVGSNDLCLLKFNTQGNLVWNITWGNIEHNCGTDVTVDSNGDIYVSGWTYESGVGNRMVLLKYNGSGDLQWEKIPSIGEWGRGVAVDNTTGDIYLVGDDIYNIYLVKYNNSGDEQWSRVWDSGLQDGVRAVNVDSSGNIYLTGYTETSSNGDEILLIKYDTFGNELWNTKWGANFGDRGQNLFIDSTDNVYITGMVENYGGTNSYDVCILKYNSNSDLQWSETWGGNMTDYGFGISIDEFNYIYIAGFTQSFVDIEGDAFLLRCNLNFPSIIINSPIPNQVCGITAPYFNISIYNLDIQEKWYSFNGGDNITFTTETQFNQIEWDKVGNGPVLITFYANDTAGFITSSEVLVSKDNLRPEIIILSPSENDIFSGGAPSYKVDIRDVNLDKMWYTLNNGAQKEFMTNNSIAQGLWDSLAEGNINLSFYANDTVGNLNYASVRIKKDTTFPVITIISPNASDVFGIEAPSFEISIMDIHFESAWYTLDQGVTNTSFSGFIGDIDQNIWDNAAQGEITIIFYARDEAGNIGFQSIIIIKIVPFQLEISGYNAILLIGVIFIISIYTIKKKFKK
ncbi:MAG: hypothetical protein ACFFG0_51845, partial [Candidatus Thorarchaeota archaeon]